MPKKSHSAEESSPLDYLNDLIAKGIEYPDAEWKTSRKFGIKAEILREQYDNKFCSDTEI